MARNKPIELAGIKLELFPPRLEVEKWDLLQATADADGSSQVGLRVFAAALGLSWPLFRRAKDAPAYRGDVIDYGGKVIQYLAGKGLTQIEAMDAVCVHGSKALQMCAEDTVNAADEEEAQGK